MQSKQKPQVREDRDILVFVSYAAKDGTAFNIKGIIEELTKTPDIFDVLYDKKTCMKFMSDNLGNCDVVLLFCSPTALNSEPVKKEWTAADAMNKPIIPVFFKPDHIPPLLRSRLGVEFDQFDFEKNVKQLHQLILKKAQE
ncbi:MAG: toll/interleukin-1 receptor domain-containing protein [Promethearchaeota archaeon]